MRPGGLGAANGLPGQLRGYRTTGVISDECFETVLDLRPPRRVVHGVGLWQEREHDASLLEVIHDRLHALDRVEWIAATVDDEERPVQQVVRIKIAELEVFVLEHANVAIQRKKA